MFRKAALDHLSSPDDLDQIVRITTVATWPAWTAMLLLCAGAAVWVDLATISATVRGTGVIANADNLIDVVAPATGSLLSIDAVVGQHVGAGQGVAVVRATGGADRRVTASAAGEVVELPVSVGAIVAAGRPLVRLATGPGAFQVLTYVPSDQAGAVRPDMEVRVFPAIFKREEYGFISGRVAVVGKVAANAAADAEFTPMRVSLDRDARTASSFHWSIGRGPSLKFVAGIPVVVEIVTWTRAPITLLALREKLGL